MEGDYVASRSLNPPEYFNPLPPCGGRRTIRITTCCCWYFNPLPPCGGRHRMRIISIAFPRFQSTPSVWRETVCRLRSISSIKFQSTPSVWRETARPPLERSTYGLFQSTPSVWRETLCCKFFGQFIFISIHSLRVEGDVTTV